MEEKYSDKDYKFNFKTKIKNITDSGKGLSKDVVEFISKMKNEPEWMRTFRLQSYEYFLKIENPKWGPDLSQINFDDYTYYIKSTKKTENTWEEVPESIKQTFEKIGIPKSERKYFSGASAQFESEVVYHKNLQELEKLGVIFADTDTALKKFPELFKEYFSKVVTASDNKYASLNSAVWSGGSFIYVPKNVKLSKPVQSYFRINSERMGQFERTLIIVDEGASVHYIEGCTAPLYSKNSLHAAVVEIFVKKNAHCRYSTVQNWSDNIINLVTKRSLVEENGTMEWIDGNIGSGLNMKYPACILKGDAAKGTCISIAVASKNQLQDTGAKMIHIGKNTRSVVVSKSIAKEGGRVNYRGRVRAMPGAKGAQSHVECGTLILDEISQSDTFPLNQGRNND
ncbi:MAG: Fe-S cluster assembly protein SufB, partial [Cytophagales bacterium]|nr:Fe-S cluster assembly protein SufB [Cytophagales bacterium]